MKSHVTSVANPSLYPDLATAQKIWQKGIDYRSATTAFENRDEYIFHSTGVAESARIIAANTPYLNPEKAYVLGLLHDYGKKYDELTSGIFHVQAGYEELMAKGYQDSARICLTHSFPNPEFEDQDYPSYRPEWLCWAHQKMQGIIFDDYDRLIQLCDMFFEGLSKVNFQKRFAGIARRYGFPRQQLARLEQAAIANKAYFDGLCGADIYRLLRISEL